MGPSTQRYRIPMSQHDDPQESPGGQPVNLITPSGYQKLVDELNFLLKKDRPRIVEEIQAAVKQGDRSENAEYQYGKKRLREIDRRVRFLNKRVESARVIDPCAQNPDCVRFGATVTVETEEGTLKTYCIVGEDEIDTKLRKISWKSPIGRGLLKARLGEALVVETPGGPVDLVIADIKYVPL